MGVNSGRGESNPRNRGFWGGVFIKLGKIKLSPPKVNVLIIGCYAFIESFLGVNGVAGTKENFVGYYVEVSRAISY